jgi:tetracycline resistance efflux pump
MHMEIVSLLIPLLTIFLAIITKDVLVSLLGGIFVGYLTLHGFNPLLAIVALFDGIIATITEGWIAKTLLFVLFVGSIIRLLTLSGAVERFVAYLSLKAKTLDSPRGAMLLAYLIGVVIFIESSITSLVAGTVTKPLCDKHGVSRAKLAYICDSTSAPICSLIPLNGWGALLLGLITAGVTQGVIEGNSITLLLNAMPYNFYAWITLLIVLLVIFFRIEIGPMRHSKAIPLQTTTHTMLPPSLIDVLLPILFLIVTVFLTLYYTGTQALTEVTLKEATLFDILQKSSGSTSVYYGVIATLLFLYLFYVPRKRLTHKTYLQGIFEGMSEMLPITAVLLFAILIGKVIGELGTATYLATLLHGTLSPALIPLLIFLVAALISFSTGTSWGTFSIMMPIALTLGATMELHLPLVIAAVISGGIFGDHASPISDTTIISSMASGCDPIEHVRTQLPYALIGGILAGLAFLLFGYI